MNIVEYVDDNAARFLAELSELIAIPSISTLPEHAPDVAAAAVWLAAQLRERCGLAVAEVIETHGHPLVYGEWLGAPGKPTVLIYGHYDVQPVDPLELWRTPPFSPTVVGESLYGRGASDDKGPTFAALKALEALLVVRGALPVNVKVLLEGEEESGGESIAAYVRANPARLAADCALILDTGMLDKGVPTMSYALRGIEYCEIVARGADHDLHSGVYGGIAPNPIQALCWLLAEIKGRDGRIDIPGLYEQMRPLTAQEVAGIDALEAFAAPHLASAAGLSALPGEAGYGAVMRSTARPTFEVHGIRGGFVGEGAKTVIPAEALAKVSMRLVADQTAAGALALLRARVAACAVDGISFEVRDLHGGDPVSFSLEASALRHAAAALEAEFGRPVAIVREGGSIPIATLFVTALGLPAAMFGFGLVDDNVHAPNEKLHLPNFSHAIRAVAGFLDRLGG